MWPNQDLIHGGNIDSTYQTESVNSCYTWMYVHFFIVHVILYLYSNNNEKQLNLPKSKN